MKRKPANPTPASRGVASMVPGTTGFDVAADLVSAEIERAGWGISELAKRSGVHRVALHEWLAGRRPLRADYLLAIILATGITLSPQALRDRAQPANPPRR